MALDIASIYANAKDAWPGVDTDDLIWIAPLGSRKDALIFNRANGQVTTGRLGSGPCFCNTLDAFAEKVEDDYGQRLETPYGDTRPNVRRRDEYRAAIAFLRALAPN